MDIKTVIGNVIGGEPSKKMIVVVITSVLYLLSDKLGIDRGAIKELINWLILPWLGLQGAKDVVTAMTSGGATKSPNA